MSGFELYLLLLLDNLNAFFIIFSILLIVSAGIMALYAALEMEDVKHWKAAGIAGFVFAFIAVLLPSTKDAVLIYVVPPVINSERAQEIPEKILDLVDVWLEEAKPKK